LQFQAVRRPPSTSVEGYFIHALLPVVWTNTGTLVT
jgi:hypothetical protein